MLNRLPLIWFFCACLSVLPGLAVADTTGFPDGAEQAVTLQPQELMAKAPPLLKAGRENEAVFWFYAGQLRWRGRLIADPNQDPTGSPALFSSFLEVIGPDVNIWAFGDIPQLQRTIAAVLEWDRRYPDPSVPAGANDTARSGLEKLSAQIGQDASNIRQQRAAKGFTNR